MREDCARAEVRMCQVAYNQTYHGDKSQDTLGPDAVLADTPTREGVRRIELFHVSNPQLLLFCMVKRDRGAGQLVLRGYIFLQAHNPEAVHSADGIVA